MKVKKTFASDDSKFLLMETENSGMFEFNSGTKLTMAELQKLFVFVGEFLHMHGSTSPEIVTQQYTQLALPLAATSVPAADTRKNRPSRPVADEGKFFGIPE